VYKTKLARTLPPVLMALSEISLQLQRHPHPSVHGDIYWRSTLDLVCAGLSAPADQLRVLIYALSSYRMGVFSGDVVYLALVGILWYAVGKKIDSWRLHDSGAHRKPSPVGIFGNLLAALYGLYLLLFSCSTTSRSRLPETEMGVAPTSSAISSTKAFGFFGR
jgi:hypothetical protein